MSNKIAVITDLSGNVTTIDAGSAIRVYAPSGSGWSIHAIEEYALPLTDMSLLRDALRDLISRLGDCKIVCGSAVAGLAFYAFEQMGFSVFEVDAVSDELFDSILSDLRDGEANAKTYPTAPVETERAGYFHIDLIALQEFHPEVSSKMAMRDFINAAEFRELELICSHVPVWIEEQIFADGRFVCAAEPLGDDRFRVTIAVAAHDAL